MHFNFFGLHASQYETAGIVWIKVCKIAYNHARACVWFNFTLATVLNSEWLFVLRCAWLTPPSRHPFTPFFFFLGLGFRGSGPKIIIFIILNFEKKIQYDWSRLFFNMFKVYYVIGLHKSLSCYHHDHAWTLDNTWLGDSWILLWMWCDVYIAHSAVLSILFFLIHFL